MPMTHSLLWTAVNLVWKRRMTILNEFYYYSGLKINIEKTLAVWLGNKAGSDERICREYNLNWTNEPFNILGIRITT